MLEPAIEGTEIVKVPRSSLPTIPSFKTALVKTKDEKE
jgi:hypothetical protein